MPKYQIIAPALPNIPWQEKPENAKNSPLWRYSENPIIDRNPIPGVARIFNSAVMPYGDAFIGVFRGEQTNGIPHIYLGRSKDAIHWDIEPEKIPFVDENGESFMPYYAYDPRLVKVEDTYYIMWCQDFYGAAIGVAKTQDFKTFTRIENPFLPFNRNAVLFPRKINGMLKKELAAAKIRPTVQDQMWQPNPNRDMRKAPSEKVAARTGVHKYYDYEINELITACPQRVEIPLNMHIGAPALPLVLPGERVQEGQLIAQPPEGALGARIHASISGVVESTDERIVITAK